uniref:DDE Tnp4 domain-containing protein n=1 Tax=Anopheles atroparvus TaxID=41427 RepID=A0AAG5DFQ1_ANOAO
MNTNFDDALLTWTEAWSSFMRLHLLQQRRYKKRIWMRPMLLERNQQASQLLQAVLEEELDKTIVNFMRLSRTDFNYLLSIITPKIRKQDTYMRYAISARDKLIITLRFLAAGDDYKSLEYAYRVSEQAISLFIPHVCDSLVQLLQDYVKLPSSSEEWLQVSGAFQNKWNFPHAIGAIDGKHVKIKAPKNSGTDYFNYKQFFSIVLLAIVDANCNFLFVDVGGKGRISDGGILRHSRLFNLLENKQLNIPEPQVLRSDPSSLKVPYFLLGDKAFAFTDYCIRPFGGITETRSPERIFNERHSRARRTVEMAFGILTSRFRVLKKVMELEPEIASKVVLATVYLHNFIRRDERSIMSEESSLNQEVLPELHGITTRTTNQLMAIRLHLADLMSRNIL